MKLHPHLPKITWAQFVTSKSEMQLAILNAIHQCSLDAGNISVTWCNIRGFLLTFPKLQLTSITCLQYITVWYTHEGVTCIVYDLTHVWMTAGYSKYIHTWTNRKCTETTFSTVNRYHSVLHLNLLIGKITQLTVVCWSADEWWTSISSKYIRISW